MDKRISLGLLLLLILIAAISYVADHYDNNRCETSCKTQSIEHLVFSNMVNDMCVCYYATGEYNSIKLIGRGQLVK